ncbi:hypothetical protein L3V82_06485 [Thiotrichales bacterium 19S3-7]|nr:hypothetical protein [Thiotrichales bacterium 19S3-7]MCF6801744.1 hypothetical protein [Thiotrichales bacterium 19S3-11]
MTQHQVQHHLNLIAAAQVPHLETCWMEGYAYSQRFAEHSNHSERYNPYPKGSKAYRYWQEGFDSGLFDEAPLFPEHAVDLANAKVDLAQSSSHWFYKASIIAGGAALCVAAILEIAA